MTTETAERQEETIASVRADLELRHTEAREARRIEIKRGLLEQIVRQSRDVESLFQAVKARKKSLKELRNDLVQMDADDLDNEDLSRLLDKINCALGCQDSHVTIAVHAVAPPTKRATGYAAAC